MYISMEECIRANNGRKFKGIVHIGAHHGEEAEAYAAAGIKNVLWVEANKKMMKHLYDKTHNVPINSLYFCTTLSDEDDQVVEFNVANNGQSSSLLDLGTHATMYPHIKYTEKQTVKTKTFESLVRENIAQINLDLYDFINIDVQGAELQVLKGFGPLFERFDFKAVYTEVNFEEVYKGCCLIGDLDEFLHERKFSRVLTAAPEGTWGDALYLKKG